MVTWRCTQGMAMGIWMSSWRLWNILPRQRAKIWAGMAGGAASLVVHSRLVRLALGRDKVKSPLLCRDGDGAGGTICYKSAIITGRCPQGHPHCCHSSEGESWVQKCGARAGSPLPLPPLVQHPGVLFGQVRVNGSLLLAQRCHLERIK